MPNTKSFITKKSEDFLKRYLNNASPTGFESEGQKIWLDYIKPYIDDTIIDTYGTAVGVINPNLLTFPLRWLDYKRHKYN